MANFNDFLDSIKDALETFAKDQWSEQKSAAVADGNAFIDQSKADLERWTKALADGNLSKSDFEWLIESRKDLFELISLKQIGLSKIAANRFKNGVIDLVIETAFKVFL